AASRLNAGEEMRAPGNADEKFRTAAGYPASPQVAGEPARAERIGREIESGFAGPRLAAAEGRRIQRGRRPRRPLCRDRRGCPSQRCAAARFSTERANYFRCFPTSFVISNMFTADLPPKTAFSVASALIMRLFLAS